MQSSFPGIEVVPYSDSCRSEWDRFVQESKTPHFFFKRDFMEYHSDRFDDASLLFYMKNRPIAVLPSNRSGDTLYSHQGLTYGGVLADQQMSGELMLQLFDRLMGYLRSEGASKLVYKKIPQIYHRMPADEDIYCLHRAGARVVKCELSSAVSQSCRVPYTKGKKWNLGKARKSGVQVQVSSNFNGFMGLLEDVLRQRHGVSPVHTVDEIVMLAARFPDNIKLYSAELNGEMLAGALMFENDTVAHAQYLANSDAGLEVAALDMVLDHLLNEVYVNKPFFSFGISTENAGLDLNAGLLRSKEGFGARGIVHQTYELIL